MKKYRAFIMFDGKERDVYLASDIDRLRTEGRERVEKVLFEISDSYRLYNKNMRMAWADRILSALFDEEGK